MNHHSPDVTASDTMAKSADPSPPPRAPRNRPVLPRAQHGHQQPGHPRQYAPTAPARGGRRHARRYTRCSAVVNELAKKIVSTQTEHARFALGRHPTDANASLASTSASPRMPSRAVSVVMIDERMRSGTKAATTITRREERDERLSGERDAAIDELDLEHAFPHARRALSRRESAWHRKAPGVEQCAWAVPSFLQRLRSSLRCHGSSNSGSAPEGRPRLWLIGWRGITKEQPEPDKISPGTTDGEGAPAATPTAANAVLRRRWRW